MNQTHYLKKFITMLDILGMLKNKTERSAR